jgi:hypothetical protein
MGGKTKTMRFTGNMSISEACKDIREKTEDGGADHALFRPPNDLKHRKGAWLLGNRTFNFYDVISGEELHYRKRHRQIKISLMDGTTKLLLIDESSSIRDVCADICSNLGLEKPYEEWSLTLGSTRNFLDPVLGLQEQGVTEKDKVWLKKKHFWTDDKIDKSSPMNLSLMYHQARFGITHGEHRVTEEEAMMFAAVQLQQENGKYDKAKAKGAMKDVAHFFEEKYHKKKKLHNQALKEWETNCSHMTELDAMYQYIKLARGLATYGIVMFPVGIVVKGKRDKQTELIGVAKKEVLRMDYKTRAIIERWPYMMIKRWAATNDMFTLDFGHKRENYYSKFCFFFLCFSLFSFFSFFILDAYMVNAAGLGLQIQGYLDIMQRLRKHEGTVTEVDDKETTTIEDIDTNFGTAVEWNTTMVIVGDDDYESMDEGEYVPDDDNDPDPVIPPHRLLRPGKPGGGAGDFGESDDDDPPPADLNHKLLRPGKGPGGAGDKGPKKVFVTDVATCIDAVGELQQLIEVPLNPSKVTAIDPDKPRRAFQEGLATIPNLLDDPKENAGLIAMNLAQLIKGARQVAAMDNDISLLEAARRVAQETEEILRCAREMDDDDPDMVPLKKRMLVHKNALKGASTYGQGAVAGLLVDPASEQLLLGAARQLADAVKRMATVTASAAEETESSKLERVALDSVTLSKVIPTKVQHLCSVSTSREDIAALAEASEKAAQKIQRAMKVEDVPEQMAVRVDRAIQQVQAASAQLVDASESSQARSVQERENLAECLRKVGESAEAILESTGDKAALDEHSNLLGENLAALIAAGKNLAKQDQETISLLTAAKGVSTAVEGLLATTRDAADDTKNMALAREMLKCAQAVSYQVQGALEMEEVTLLPYSVTRHEARKVAAATAELCAKSRSVLPEVDKTRRKELITITADAESACQKMVHLISKSEANASDQAAQEKMAKQMKKHVKVFQQLTGVSRACIPAIENQSVQVELGKEVEQTAVVVKGLVSALQSIPDEGARAFLAVEKSLEKEGVKIDSAMLNAAVDNLTQTLPRMEAVEELQVTLVDLQRAMDVMRKAETTNLVSSAQKLVDCFAEVVSASVVVAAATSDAVEKQVVLQKARGMIPQIAELLSAAKSEVRGVAQEDDVSFMDAARNVSRLLRDVIGTDIAAAVKRANRRFLPDLSALLNAAKAAAGGSDEDANMSLLEAADTVSNSLKTLMATCREEDLPITLVAEVKGMLNSINMQLGEKGNSRAEGENTANAVGAVNNTVIDLLEAAQNFEEGPDDCDLVARKINSSLRSLKPAAKKPAKASLDRLVDAVEELNMAGNRAVDVSSKIPKVARAHPAELGPHVQALLPCVKSLIDACNSVSEVLPDSEAAQQVVALVRTVCESMAQMSTSSKTAKCDSGADGEMSLGLVEMRRAVRELVALSEKATPGLSELDESARIIGEAARFGVPLEVDEPCGGLTGLEAASEVLADSIKTVLAAAADDPSELGNASNEAADAALAVVSASQNYDAVTRAVTMVQRAEMLAQKLRDASAPEESKTHGEALADMLDDVIAAMKEVSQNERNTEVKNAIKAAYGDVKPAQADLVNSFKLLRRENGISNTAEAGEHFAAALRSLVFASPDARKAEDLIGAGKFVAVQAKNVIQNSMSVAKRPNDGFVKGQLLMACQDVDQSRADLLETARSMAPGRAELEAARKRIKKQVGEMEAAGIAAEIGLLNVATAKTRTEAQEALLGATGEMSDSLSGLLAAATQKNMRDMGMQALPIADHIDNTAVTSRELAGTTGDESFQIVSLGSAKTVGEAALHFVDVALDVNSEPASKTAHKKLSQARSDAVDSVAALEKALQTSAKGLARCKKAMKLILQHKAALGAAEEEDQLTYAVAQSNVIAAARGVGKAVQKVQRGARGNAPEIGEFCLQLAEAIEIFVNAVSSASECVSEKDLRKRLMGEAGRTCDETAKLCEVARSIASDPGSEKHLTQLSLSFKACTDALGGAVTGIRDAAIGEKECRDVAAIISKMQAEIDSATIFAETGHFQYGESGDMSEVTSSFEKSAKACLSRGKALVAATSSQAELAAAAQDMKKALEQLVDHGKTVASAIGDFVEFSQQKAVLLGTKNGLMGAQAVVLACSQGREAQEMAVLIRTLGQNLVSIVKSVKAAASSAIETQSAIAQAREVIESSRDGYDSLRSKIDSAKEVSDALQGVSKATSLVIAASGKTSAKEMLAALNESTEALATFLKKAKGAEKLAKGKDIGIADNSIILCDTFLELLDLVSQRKKDDWEAAEQIMDFSDIMAEKIADVIGCLKLLPGQKALDLEENALGEEVVETLTVAMKAVGDEASKLRIPEGAAKGDVGPLLVKATNAIVTATKGMLKASCATQQELVSRAKQNARLNVFARDPAWAQNLMATVEEVVRFNGFLVSVTNRAAAADMSNISTAIEELSKAARNLSNGSSKLVASAKAKSEHSSSSSQRLTKAGQAVTEAIQALIEAGKHAAEIVRANSNKADKEPYDFAKRVAGGELKAQLEIARLERELERGKAAIKIKADLADSWQESSKSGKVPSLIDRQVAERRNNRKATDYNAKLRKDIQEGKKGAQKGLAKLGRTSTHVKKKQEVEKKKSPAKKRAPVVADSVSDEDLPPPPPPAPLSDDEDGPDLPEPLSDSE